MSPSLRYKTTGPGLQSGTYYYVTDGTPGAVKSNSGEKYTKYNHLGVNTPNFTRRKKDGELIPFTPWVQREWNAHAHMSWDGGRNQPNNYHQYTVGNGNPILDALGDFTIHDRVFSWDEDTVRQAQLFVDSAAAKIYSQGWDTGVFLAELHKVFRMFRRFGGNLASLLREWHTVKRQASVTFDAWLETRYGWRLLIYDMKDIADVIQGLNEEKRTRFKEQTGRSFSLDNYVDIPLFHWSHAYHTVRFKDTYDISLRGTVIADIEPPTFRFNPVTTTWELIPWSFVLDWFVGIGSWLETLSFLAFKTNYAAARGVHINVTRTIDSHTYVFEDDDGYGPWSGVCNLECKGEGSLTLRVPTTVSNYPHLNVKLDGFKVMDLIALVFGLIRRR